MPPPPMTVDDNVSPGLTSEEMLSAGDRCINLSPMQERVPECPSNDDSDGVDPRFQAFISQGFVATPSSAQRPTKAMSVAPPLECLGKQGCSVEQAEVPSEGKQGCSVEQTEVPSEDKQSC